MTVAIATVRAFQTVVYRDLKLKVLDETVRLDERTVEQTRRLAEAGKSRASDVILARAEVDAARASLGQGRTALATAVSALQRSLGAVGSPAAVHGDLTLPATSVKGDALADAAVEQRPDVQVSPCRHRRGRGALAARDCQSLRQPFHWAGHGIQ